MAHDGVKIEDAVVVARLKERSVRLVYACVESVLTTCRHCVLHFQVQVCDASSFLDSTHVEFILNPKIAFRALCPPSTDPFVEFGASVN